MTSTAELRKSVSKANLQETFALGKVKFELDLPETCVCPFA